MRTEPALAGVQRCRRIGVEDGDVDEDEDSNAGTAGDVLVSLQKAEEAGAEEEPCAMKRSTCDCISAEPCGPCLSSCYLGLLGELVER